MTSVAETEESEIEIVCKKCGEDFKDVEGVIAHNCLYKDNEKISFYISKVFDPLQEKEKSKLAAETSVNENISVSSTSKISSPCNKISQDDSSQSLPLATSKQLYSPSTKTLKGEASRSRTSSVASHKLKSSKRSLPATTTKSSEREEPKMVNTNYPMYVTPPQSIESFQALKDNSLSVRDSTVENLFEPCKRTCSAIGYSSLPSECIKKDSVQSLTLATPEQRSFSSPQNIRVEPSRNVTTSNESYILQSPRSSCIASIGRPNEVEVLYTVDTKYPTCGTPPRSIPSSYTRKDESSRVMNLGPINLFHVPQMYSTRFFSGSPGSVVTPSAVNLDQSSRIYNTETHTNSPGIVRNPTDTTFQSSRKCITKSLVFSPVVKVQNPVPLNIAQSPYLCDATIKTNSPQIKSEKYDSPKSSTFASLKPVSPFKKSNEGSSGSVVDTTISGISHKEEFPRTEGERSDNYPGFVKGNVMKSPKNSSPSSHDSSRFFKFPGASCRSQSPSSSGGGISPKKIWIKKYHDEYISFDQDIRTSASFKLEFSKDSINSKEVVKMNPSQSPLCSSISEEKLTPETESGESKYLSFVTPKQLSPSISVCIKDFSEGFVNPESKYALQSPQNSNISDEKISQTKGKAKEGYAKS